MKGRRNSERGTAGLFLAIFVAMVPVFLCDAWRAALNPAFAARDAVHLPTAIGDYQYFPPDESLLQQEIHCVVRGRRFNVYRRSDAPVPRADAQMIPLGWEVDDHWRVYGELTAATSKDKSWPTFFGKTADGFYVELGERNHWPKK